MPTIHLLTNVRLDDAKRREAASGLSALAAELTGKSQDYVMALVQDGLELLFAGTDAPAGRVEFSSIGLPQEQGPAHAQAICAYLRDNLGIPPERVYIAFADSERARTGWNSKTFAT